MSCQHKATFQKVTFPHLPAPMSPVLWCLLSEAFGLSDLVPAKSLPTGLLTALLTICLSTKKVNTSRAGNMLFPLVYLCPLSGLSEAECLLND